MCSTKVMKVLCQVNFFMSLLMVILKKAPKRVHYLLFGMQIFSCKISTTFPSWLPWKLTSYIHITASNNIFIYIIIDY